MVKNTRRRNIRKNRKTKNMFRKRNKSKKTNKSKKRLRKKKGGMMGVQGWKGRKMSLENTIKRLLGSRKDRITLSTSSEEERKEDEAIQYEIFTLLNEYRSIFGEADYNNLMSEVNRLR